MTLGGKSFSTSPNKKTGITTRFKCKKCGREYKQEQFKAIHEKNCTGEKL